MAGRLGRRGVRIAIAVVAALVLLVALAPRLVPAGKVRELIIARARAATGADVSFGSASVRLFPRLSVAVADGRIAGTGEALRAATGQPSPLVSYRADLDRVEVSLALGPLLRRRVEIGRVRLVRPRIELVTAPPAPAGAEGEAASSPPAATSAPMALAVAALEVRDGTLAWHEAQTDRGVRVEGWEQTLTVGDLTALAARLRALSAPGGAPAAGGEARLGLSARVGTLTLERFGPVSPLRLSDLTLEAEAALPPAGDALRLTITRAAWGRIELSGEATIAAADGARRLTGSWRLRELELPQLVAALLPLAPPVPGPAGAWLAGGPVTAGRLTAAGGLTLPWPLPQPAAPDLVTRGLSASGTLRDARVGLPDGGGEVTLAADFALADGALKLTAVQAADAGGVLRLGGEASLPLPPAGGRVRADLRGSLDLAAAAPLLALVPEPRPAPGQPAAAGSWKDFRYGGKVEFTAQADLPDAPPLNRPAEWTARLQGGAPTGVKIAGTAAGFTVEGPNLAPAVAVRSLGFASDLRTATLRIEGAEHPVFAGGGEVRLTRLLPAPHAEVDLKLTRFDADKLTEMVTGTPAARAAAAVPADPLSPLLGWAVGVAVAAAPATAAALPPGQALPPRLTAGYRATADNMILGRLPYTQVTLDGTLADRVFTVPKASARLGGGTIDGSGRVDYAVDPWGRLDFAAKMAGVSAGSLLAPFTKGAAAIWEGKVGGDVSGGCGLRDQPAVLKSLSLEGLAVSNDGVIHGSQYLQEIDRYLGVRKDLKEIRFHDFTHHLKVKDGRYTISELALRGFDTDWWGDGWIGFDGGIDMRLTVKLPAGFRPEVGDFAPLLDTLRGDDGRLALAMQLTGRASRPTVALDLSGAKAKTQAKVQDDVKKGVDRLLDKLKRK